MLTNAVVTWTTEYYSHAVLELRSQGRSVPDEILSHISPGHSDNINFFGVIHVDVEAELAKLRTAGGDARSGLLSYETPASPDTQGPGLVSMYVITDHYPVD